MNIFYFCPDTDVPTGGIKQIYRHVDILNKNGFSAFVLHQTPGFRCTWFENTTKITYLPNIELRKEDFIVLSEVLGPSMVNIMRGIKKIIFNQNAYLTFRGYSLDKEDLTSPYLDKEFIAVISVSEDSYNYLKYTFSHLKIFRAYNGIDTNKFSYYPNKKPQICFMPRKNIEDVVQVINILKFRGILREFKLISIHNLSEEKVAEVFKESLFFLSFGAPEGFSLPPAEAMACGCIVIGYHGRGGKEYFKPEFSFPIEVGDIIGFAKAVEKAVEEWKKEPEITLEKGRKASKFIRENYGLEREGKSVNKIWEEIIKYV